MKTHIIRFRSEFLHPSQEVFDWHLRPGAFERLVSPWHQIRVLSCEGSPKDLGSKITLQFRFIGIPFRWVLQYKEFSEGKSYIDEQVKGPFSLWKHIHRVHPIDANSCALEDEIHFSPPFGMLSRYMKKRFLRILEWKHETLRMDLQAARRYKSPALKILVSGSTGLVGTSLIPFLRTSGHDVHRLVRKKEIKKDAVFWDPEKGEMQENDFEGFDVVIHLAGKNIASGLWNEKRKNAFFQSRVRDTQLLSQILAKRENPPKVFVCASAVGIYGNREDELLTEKSPAGRGFLAHLCVHWEEASAAIEAKGARDVHTRFGMILTPRGGMLSRLLPLFHAGLGTILGSGKQKMPWIALDDVIYGIYHCLLNEEVQGGINFVSPHGETVRSFSKKLALKLERPLFLRIGEKSLRFTLGEMADEMLLTSVNALPEKLLQSGYEFRFPTLESAFKRFLT